MPLVAGKPVAVRIEYTPRSALRPERAVMFGMEMGLTLRFGVAPPDRLISDAVGAARKADIAVVFVGERVGEGMDRQSLALQGDQDRLIQAVAAANPNTVVVLSTGGPVAMPWGELLFVMPVENSVITPAGVMRRTPPGHVPGRRNRGPSDAAAPISWPY